MQSKRRWYNGLISHANRILTVCMLALLVFFLFFVGHADLSQIDGLADETIEFLETVCQRYDGYASGQKAAQLKDIYDKTQGIRNLATSEELSDPDYLKKFIQTQGLTGIVVTDEQAVPVFWEETDGVDASETWQDFLQNENRSNIIRYKNKVYNGNVTVNGNSYDVALVSRMDADGLILCYHQVETVSTDIYQISVAQILTNNTFHKNPDILISDEDGIVSTNIEGLEESEFLGFPGTESHDMSGLIKIHLGRSTWYGKCQVFGKYYIYVFYQSKEVFSSTRSVMCLFVVIYLILCMSVVLFRRNLERKHILERHKQLNTIAAISKLYATIAIFHLQDQTIEGIAVHGCMKEILEDTKDLKTACQKITDTVVLPAYREAYEQYLDVDTLQERIRSGGNLANIFPDVDDVWYSVFLIPMDYTEDGKIKDVLFACRNINDYMQKEEAYKSQLKKAALDAQIANTAKTSFLRRMSHDVRTPVNGILGMAALAQNSLMEKDGETAEYLHKMTVAARYLQELTDDILRMSKLESGTMFFEEKPFDLTKVIHETLEYMEIRAKEKEIQLFADLSGIQHVHLVGSPLHYRQVMQNIISNAIKFNRPGGKVSLVFREYPYQDQKIRIEFSCSDTGYGMSTEFQNHVFEPFEQEADSARTNYEGTGLGLAVTKQIVEQKGGKISFISKKGKGTTFIVMIPLRIDQEYQEQAGTDEKEKSIAGVRVLLVEDNELNLEVARCLLENEGTVILEARNGKEAVDIFAASDPGSIDVILMDIMMPQMDGLEATRQIRKMEHPDAQRIPIFAMTANAFIDDVERSRKAGMNEHLAKPLDIKKIVETIYRYCVEGRDCERQS